MILVLLGESLAGIGLRRRPVPACRRRRASCRRAATRCVLALRNLTGTTQEAYGSEEWPWGLHGFREVLELLDDSGHPDLRALLEENTLGRLMDELLDRAVDQQQLAACARSAPRPT